MDILIKNIASYLNTPEPLLRKGVDRHKLQTALYIVFKENKRLNLHLSGKNIAYKFGVCRATVYNTMKWRKEVNEESYTNYLKFVSLNPSSDTEVPV